MKLLSDVRNFFAQNRVWALLFVVTLGILAFAFLEHGKKAAEHPSEAVQKLEFAEQRLKEEIRSVGGVQEFFLQKPKLFFIFNIFSLLLMAVILGGLVTDFLWVTHPGWRKGIPIAEGPTPDRKWGLGTILKIMIVFILASLGLDVLFSLLRSVLFPKSSSNLLVLLHTTFSDLVCVAAIVYFVSRLGGSWKDLGFRGVRFPRDLGAGLVGYVSVFPLFFLTLVAVALLAYSFSYEPPPHPLVEVFLEEEKRAPWLIAYSIFLACVAGPVFEEIFFRGFCYPAFKKRWGVGVALTLSAGFFAFIHQNIFAFLPIFVLGLGLGYLYEKWGTLVPSIVLHVVHNSIFIGYFFLAKKILMGI